MDNQILPKRFGEKLRIIRLSKNMSITELANQLGYSSHGYISELENGKKQPTVEFVLKVSRLFDISIDELLKDELEVNIDTTRS
jgi:transcriptional regulator with XRE-family HTH domain